jgi:hypothetical protein
LVVPSTIDSAAIRRFSPSFASGVPLRHMRPARYCLSVALISSILPFPCPGAPIARSIVILNLTAR